MAAAIARTRTKAKAGTAKLRRVKPGELSERTETRSRSWRWEVYVYEPRVSKPAELIFSCDDYQEAQEFVDEMRNPPVFTDNEYAIIPGPRSTPAAVNLPPLRYFCRSQNGVFITTMPDPRMGVVNQVNYNYGSTCQAGIVEPEREGGAS